MLPEPEPSLLRRRIAPHSPGVNASDDNSTTQPSVRDGPTTSAIVSAVMRVLQSDQQAVGLQIGLDEFAGPARVVSLHHQQHDIEVAVERAHVAQVIGASTATCSSASRHGDVQPSRAHRLDMRRPLVDQRHVVAGRDQVGGDATAVRTGAEHRDCLVHTALSLHTARTRRQPRARIGRDAACPVTTAIPVIHSGMTR